MRDHYLTIARTSEGFYKEKGSKFIAYAFPAKTEVEVKEQLAALRKSYYDACHHCYAYRLGHEGEQFRANDDGEPGHSAGAPILGQLKSRDLTNALVVVVRYFGGTKLGVSGLVNAYKTAAAEALEANEIVTEEITQSVRFSFPYDEMNAVMKLCKELELKITGQFYESQCTLEAEVIVSKLNLLERKWNLMHKTGSDIRLKRI